MWIKTKDKKEKKEKNRSAKHGQERKWSNKGWEERKMVLNLLIFFFSSRRRHTRWSGDWSSDVCSSDLLFLPNSRCGSAPSFYPAIFSLRQHPRFLYCPFLVAAAPHFLYCPVFVAAAPLVFILPFSRCGSTQLFILPPFSLRQLPRFFLLTI